MNGLGRRPDTPNGSVLDQKRPASAVFGAVKRSHVSAPMTVHKNGPSLHGPSSLRSNASTDTLHRTTSAMEKPRTLHDIHYTAKDNFFRPTSAPYKRTPISPATHKSGPSHISSAAPTRAQLVFQEVMDNVVDDRTHVTMNQYIANKMPIIEMTPNSVVDVFKDKRNPTFFWFGFQFETIPDPDGDPVDVDIMSFSLGADGRCTGPGDIVSWVNPKGTQEHITFTEGGKCGDLSTLRFNIYQANCLGVQELAIVAVLRDAKMRGQRLSTNVASIKMTAYDKHVHRFRDVASVALDDWMSPLSSIIQIATLKRVGRPNKWALVFPDKELNLGMSGLTKYFFEGKGSVEVDAPWALPPEEDESHLSSLDASMGPVVRNAGSSGSRSLPRGPPWMRQSSAIDPVDGSMDASLGLGQHIDDPMNNSMSQGASMKGPMKGPMKGSRPGSKIAGSPAGEYETGPDGEAILQTGETFPLVKHPAVVTAHVSWMSIATQKDILDPNMDVWVAILDAHGNQLEQTVCSSNIKGNGVRHSGNASYPRSGGMFNDYIEITPGKLDPKAAQIVFLGVIDPAHKKKGVTLRNIACTTIEFALKNNAAESTVPACRYDLETAQSATCMEIGKMNIKDGKVLSIQGGGRVLHFDSPEDLSQLFKKLYKETSAAKASKTIAAHEARDLSETYPLMRLLSICMGWDLVDEEHTVDCDLMALGLSKDDKLQSTRDFVYFNNKHNKMRTINHMGDCRAGEKVGDDEIIEIDLHHQRPTVETILILAIIYKAKSRGQNFGMMSNLYFRAFDTRQMYFKSAGADSLGAEIFRYEAHIPTIKDDTAFEVARIEKKGQRWVFTACTHSFHGSFKEIAKLYRREFLPAGRIAPVPEYIEILGVGLAWDEREVDLDLDVVAVGLNSDGKAIYCVSPYALTTADGAIHHEGDAMTGAVIGDDETININMDWLSSQCVQILFFVTHKHDAPDCNIDLGHVPMLSIHLYDKKMPSEEIARFDADGDDHYDDLSTQVGRLERSKDENGDFGPWQFLAVGEGYSIDAYQYISQQYDIPLPGTERRSTKTKTRRILSRNINVDTKRRRSVVDLDVSQKEN